MSALWELISERLERQNVRHDGTQQRLDHLTHLVERLITMSGDLNTRLANVTAELTQLRTDGAKFRADVLAALATIGAGPLNADQQAAFDALDASLRDEDTATTAADAALPVSPTPAA